MDIESIKKDFPIFNSAEKLVYLDSAATSQTPKVVLDAMNEYYEGYRSNIHRGIYEIGERASHAYEGARADVARFIGAQGAEVIFTGSATLSSNMLAYILENSMDLSQGDEIVLSVMEHHASIIPFQKFAERRKLVLKYIPMNDDFSLDYEKAKELITPKTKIVLTVLVSNVLGTINDVKQIGETAHKNGALMIVDATEAVGHIPVNVKDIDCDFLFFSGHKMCGPTGIGVLYGRGVLLEKMNPGLWGGGIVRDVDFRSAEWSTAPTRFEPGTPNIAGAIGLGAAVRYLDGIGVENIRNHTRDLLQEGFRALSEIDGLRILAQQDVEKNAGIISFVIEGVHPHDLAQIAGDNGVAIRAGHHCAQPLMKDLGVNATARASFYVYNTLEDIQMLTRALVKAKELFNKHTKA